MKQARQPKIAKTKPLAVVLTVAEVTNRHHPIQDAKASLTERLIERLTVHVDLAMCIKSLLLGIAAILAVWNAPQGIVSLKGLLELVK